MKPLDLFVGESYFLNQVSKEVEVFITELVIDEGRGNHLDEVLILNELGNDCAHSVPRSICKR